MAKQQTVRSTIRNDPFETLIPNRFAEMDEKPLALAEVSRENGHNGEKAHKKEKLTVHLTHDLIERIKNAAYWEPELTIASIAERGIKHAMAEVEREHGGPYQKRKSELKGGRPIGS
jgi:hypothetical protein